MHAAFPFCEECGETSPDTIYRELASGSISPNYPSPLATYRFSTAEARCTCITLSQRLESGLLLTQRIESGGAGYTSPTTNPVQRLTRYIKSWRVRLHARNPQHDVSHARERGISCLGSLRRCIPGTSTRGSLDTTDRKLASAVFVSMLQA